MHSGGAEEKDAVGLRAVARRRAFWIQRLLSSREDSPWIHKTLGAAALVSFTWRIFLYLLDNIDSDMGFALHPQWTWPTIALHAALSLSSFVFDIPIQRIKTDGGRIWPEYRYHSVIFTLRSLACLALNAYQDEQQQAPSHNPTYDFYAAVRQGRFWIVLASLAAADAASYTVGAYHSRSVRDLKAPAVAKYYFSVMQILATAVHLVMVDGRRNSLLFYLVLVLQVSAFLLTLRRRQLVSHEFNLVAYSLLLLGGFAMGLYECVVVWGWRHQEQRDDANVHHPLALAAVLALTACTAAIGRMGPWHGNKYVVWMLAYGLLDRIWYPLLHQDASSSAASIMTQDQMVCCAYGALVLLVVLGVYKVKYR